MQGMSSLASLFPPSQPSLPPVLQTRRASVPVMYTPPLARDANALIFERPLQGMIAQSVRSRRFSALAVFC